MKDRFSKHANQYAQYRPTYPPALYDFIYKHVQHFDVVWDCGTGNGQAACDLSKKFKKVFATDSSAKQIENAYQAENVFYSIANEKSSFAEKSVDLITVAQAAHWLNKEAFSQEAKRVAKPNGIIAIWGYSLLTINYEIDTLLNHFYTQVIGAYWDQERRHIDEHYRKLYFPFPEIQCPSFTISVSWTLEELEGYITTWSAVQKFIQRHNYNPIDEIIKNIQPLWIYKKNKITFPLFLRMGKVV